MLKKNFVIVLPCSEPNAIPELKRKIFYLLENTMGECCICESSLYGEGATIISPYVKDGLKQWNNKNCSKCSEYWDVKAAIDDRVSFLVKKSLIIT